MRPRFSILPLGAFSIGLFLFPCAGRGTAITIPVTSYAYTGSSILPHASYPDTGTIELTDGIIGTADNPGLNSPPWVGYAGSATGQPEVDFNLNGTWNVATVTIVYAVLPGAGINAPVSTLISLSTNNGATYPTSESFNSSYFDATSSFPYPDGTLHTAVLPLTGAPSATDVRVNITGSSFVFLTEISFDDGAAAVPEPGTLAMGLLGLVGLAACVWRRRLSRRA